MPDVPKKKQEAATSDVPTLAEADAASEAAEGAKVDKRREVGVGEAAWRRPNETAAGTLGLLSGAAATLGYPITAADEAISGRPVRSLAETVSDAEAPAERARAQYRIDPTTEKMGTAAQIASGVTGAVPDLVTMASMPAAKVV